MATTQSFKNVSLTGFGQKFIETGVLRGYGYVRGGVTGYTSPKVKMTDTWMRLKDAMADLDANAVIEIAAKLPSLSVTIQPHPRAGHRDLRVSYKGAMLLQADKF